jgi:hypothetical protein
MDGLNPQVSDEGPAVLPVRNHIVVARPEVGDFDVAVVACFAIEKGPEGQPLRFGCTMGGEFQFANSADE